MATHQLGEWHFALVAEVIIAQVELDTVFETDIAQQTCLNGQFQLRKGRLYFNETFWIL